MSVVINKVFRYYPWSYGQKLVSTCLTIFTSVILLDSARLVVSIFFVLYVFPPILLLIFYKKIHNSIFIGHISYTDPLEEKFWTHFFIICKIENTFINFKKLFFIKMSITINTFSCPIVYSRQYNNLAKKFFKQK